MILKLAQRNHWHRLDMTSMHNEVRGQQRSLRCRFVNTLKTRILQHLISYDYQTCSKEPLTEVAYELYVNWSQRSARGHNNFHYNSLWYSSSEYDLQQSLNMLKRTWLELYVTFMQIKVKGHVGVICKNPKNTYL